MTKRSRRKSDYEKFLRTVAPDLVVSSKILRRNNPEYDPQKSYLNLLANQTKSRSRGNINLTQ